MATAALAAGCGANSTSPSAPTVPPAPSASAPAPAQGHGARRGVQGIVTAEDGSTWTVTTDAQRDFTVTLTPQTAFGTKKAPGTAQQFPVGTRVRVAGTVNGTAVTAVRIVPGTAGKRAADATGAPTPAPTTPAVLNPATPAT